MYVASFRATCSFYYCSLRLCCLRQQVMRFKPIVLISTVISTWPCCSCYGSGCGVVMLFLLVTYRYAQVCFSYPVILQALCHLLDKS